MSGTNDPEKVIEEVNPNPEVDPKDKIEEVDDFDYSNTEAVKAEIKKLRKESADRRLKNKELTQKLTGFETTLGAIKSKLGLEDDELTLEEKAERIQAENEQLQQQLFIGEIEQELGISKEQRKFFRFLLNEKLEALEEGDELGEEELLQIVAELKETTGAKEVKSSTGVTPKGKTPDNGNNGLTVEQFAKMNVAEKSKLYQDDPAEYNRLFSEAREKRLLT